MPRRGKETRRRIIDAAYELFYRNGFARATAMEFAAFPGHPARRAAHRHKAAVEAWLTQRFAAHGIKTPDELASEVTILIEGCHSLALIHGDPSYAKTALSVARTLVEHHHPVIGKRAGNNPRRKPRTYS